MKNIVCLADPKSGQVFLLDSHGNHIKTFGGKGNGPGEFQNIKIIEWSSEMNAFVIFDGNNRKVVSYAPNGSLIQEAFLQGEVNPRFPISFLSLSEIIIVNTAKPPSLCLQNVRGSKITKLHTVKDYNLQLITKIPLGEGNVIELSFIWDPTIIYSRNNEFLAINYNINNTIYVYSLENGKLRFRLMPDLPKILITKEDKTMAFASFPTPWKKSIKNVNIPKYWPLIKKLFIDSENNLWVFNHTYAQGQKTKLLVYNEKNILITEDAIDRVPAAIMNAFFYTFVDHSDGFVLQKKPFVLDIK